MQQQDLFLELGPNCPCHADSPVYLRVVTDTEILWYEAKAVVRVLDEWPEVEYGALQFEAGAIVKRVPLIIPKTPDTRILPSIQIIQETRRETEPRLLLGTHPQGGESTVWAPEVAYDAIVTSSSQAAQHTYTVACDGLHAPSPCPVSQASEIPIRRRSPDDQQHYLNDRLPDLRSQLEKSGVPAAEIDAFFADMRRGTPEVPVPPTPHADHELELKREAADRLVERGMHNDGPFGDTNWRDVVLDAMADDGPLSGTLGNKSGMFDLPDWPRTDHDRKDFGE